MSALDFQDREPELNQARRMDNQVLSANSAFYERLQGQGRKSAIERYGWIAVPVAAVAIIGIAAATSTPRSSTNDAGGPPTQTTASASAPATATVATPAARNDALASNDPAKASDLSASSKPVASASTAAKSVSSAPAPVKVARRAAAAPIRRTPARRRLPRPNVALRRPTRR